MISYIIRRILATIPLLLVVVTISFVLVRLAPGDPVEVRLGIYASEMTVQAMREEMGLNKPLWSQYFDFLGGLVRGDFGRSLINQRAISAELGYALPYTLELTFAGMILGIIFGLPLGIWAALRRNSLPDYGGRIFSLAGLSLPSFYLGILLMLLFSVKLRLFPVVGGGDIHNLGDKLYHLFLPALTLGLIQASYITRVSRSSVLNILGEEYVKTARSKGLKERTVIYKHVLKNALIPIISLIGVYSIVLIGGSVMVEIVFSRPGLAKMMIGALKGRDYTVLQSVLVIYASFVVIINLLTDLACRLVDPRIKLSKRER